MALNIKSAEADRLARELAAITGETITEAITIALEERLQRELSRRGPALRDRLHRLQSDVARLQIKDGRTCEEIVGYDADGLPG